MFPFYFLISLCCCFTLLKEHSAFSSIKKSRKWSQTVAHYVAQSAYKSWEEDFFKMMNNNKDDIKNMIPTLIEQQLSGRKLQQYAKQYEENNPLDYHLIEWMEQQMHPAICKATQEQLIKKIAISMQTKVLFSKEVYSFQQLFLAGRNHFPLPKSTTLNVEKEILQKILPLISRYWGEPIRQSMNQAWKERQYQFFNSYFRLFLQNKSKNEYYFPHSQSSIKWDEAFSISSESFLCC